MKRSEMRGVTIRRIAIGIIATAWYFVIIALLTAESPSDICAKVQAVSFDVCLSNVR